MSNFGRVSAVKGGLVVLPPSTSHPVLDVSYIEKLDFPNEKVFSVAGVDVTLGQLREGVVLYHLNLGEKKCPSHGWSVADENLGCLNCLPLDVIRGTIDKWTFFYWFLTIGPIGLIVLGLSTLYAMSGKILQEKDLAIILLISLVCVLSTVFGAVWASIFKSKVASLKTNYEKLLSA